MDELTDYEKRRAENIARNKAKLVELGLAKTSPNTQSLRQPGRSKKLNRRLINSRSEFKTNHTLPRRKSQRAVNKPVKKIEGLSDVEDSDNEIPRKRRKTDDDGEWVKSYAKQSSAIDCTVSTWNGHIWDKSNGNVFGDIPTVPVGTVFASRLDACNAGVHRHTVAGIHGQSDEGCYSICVNGGYDDNIDLGYAFTYTGSGGRDLKGTKQNPKNLRTAAQSKDQELTIGNAALIKSEGHKKPVRVLRGPKCGSKYAPFGGYRYDVLYQVESWWQDVGLSGFMVYKFALKRLPNQPELPIQEGWDSDEEEEELEGGKEIERVKSQAGVRKVGKNMVITEEQTEAFEENVKSATNRQRRKNTAGSIVLTQASTATYLNRDVINEAVTDRNDKIEDVEQLTQDSEEVVEPDFAKGPEECGVGMISKVATKVAKANSNRNPIAPIEMEGCVSEEFNERYNPCDKTSFNKHPLPIENNESKLEEQSKARDDGATAQSVISAFGVNETKHLNEFLDNKENEVVA